MKTAYKVFLLSFVIASVLIIPKISSEARTSNAAEFIYPGSSWQTATPAEMGLDSTKLNQAVNYAGGSGYIIRGGKVVRSWGSSTTRYDLKSTTKSIGGIALGLAIADGRLSLTDRADDKHPSFGIPPQSNQNTGWLPNITIKHLATHTAGFDKDGGYDNLLFAPGTKWHYSDGSLNWLAETITLAYGQDLNTLLFNRVFTPMGITSNDLTWRSNQFRDDTINGIKNRELASGISADVDALARIGYLYLRKGNWNGQQIVPESFVNLSGVAQSGVVGLPEHDPSISYNASEHYGLLWWTNADGTLANVPEDAYWSWGLYDSFIIVIPSLDIVAVRAGTSAQRLQSGWVPNYAVIKPFIEPIAQSVLGSVPSPTPTQNPTPPPSGGTIIDMYASAVGSPRMELRINDQVVQSFNVSGSNKKYSYTASGSVSVEQIKVAFVNDAANTDLIVDRIVVNGTTYQSEASTTFSVGVYTNGKCQMGGGYFMKDRLACNGYFRYAEGTQPASSPTSTPSPNPTITPTSTPTPLPTGGDVVTTIDIYAAPAGSPEMELRINDQTVAAFNVSGGSPILRNFLKYSYSANASVPVSANQIKVVFTNDGGGNDLFVDRVVVNGTTYQSEAPTTFSTGVYASGKCQTQGGYFQKEKLACNGYFRYAQ